MTAEEILKEKGNSIISASPNTTIRDAVELMLQHRIGSLVVKDAEAYVGIWTERDLLKDVVQEGFDLLTSRIGDYMATGLQYAKHSDDEYCLMDKFLGLHLRRLLVRKSGKLIGILTPGDVMKACAMAKDAELRSLNAMAGWEYYEEWRWKPGEQGRDSQ